MRSLDIPLCDNNRVSQNSPGRPLQQRMKLLLVDRFMRLIVQLLGALAAQISCFYILRWLRTKFSHEDILRILQAKRSTERSRKLATSISDAEAGMLLLSSQKQKLQESLSSTSAADQLVVAASLRPKRSRSKWQQSYFEGPTARKDANASERIRWVTLLADLLMGRLIRESPSKIQLLGSGLRARTLRSRVRAAQKFLGWLATAHSVAFPKYWKQMIEYLQVRVSEPCVRGALKATRRSY